MLAAYLDESFDSGKRGCYVVAGVLGDGWRLLRAEGAWRALLGKHGLSKFKLGDFRKSSPVVPEFAAVIRDSGLFAFGLIADQSLVQKHLGGSVLARQYQESPYMLLYQFSFIRIAMKLRSLGSTDYVAFVCDENARYLGILARSYSGLRELNKQSAPYMGSCSICKDDECAPLQMADLLAGEIRRKAPTWKNGDQGFSESLRLLLEAETLGWVSVLDEETLSSVRQLVDSRQRQSS